MVGGPHAFLETLYAHLPLPPDTQIREFLATWKDYRERWSSKIDWLPRLLTHLYGEERAQRLLTDAGLA